MRSLPPSQEPREPQTQISGKTRFLDMDFKYAALLAYMPIIPVNIIFSLIWLKTEPGSQWLRFHSAQSLILGGIIVVTMIIMQVMKDIPVIGMLTNLLLGLVVVVIFVVDIIALLKANSGELYKIPTISDWASQLLGEPHNSFREGYNRAMQVGCAIAQQLHSPLSSGIAGIAPPTFPIETSAFRPGEACLAPTIPMNGLVYTD